MKKSNNPFKMKLPWWLGVIGLILGIFVTSQSGSDAIAWALPSLPSIYVLMFLGWDTGISSIVLMIPILNFVIYFLVGWGIQYLWRKFRK